MLDERSFRAKERAARTENLLVTVAGDFFPLYGAIQRRKQDIALMHDRPPIVDNLREILGRLRIDISARLDEAMPLSIDMDAEAIDPLRQTIMLTTSYNALLEGVINSWPFDFDQWPEAMDRLEANRAIAEQYAQQLAIRYQTRAA